jgi:hypothetical protein
MTAGASFRGETRIPKLPDDQPGLPAGNHVYPSLQYNAKADLPRLYSWLPSIKKDRKAVHF